MSSGPTNAETKAPSSWNVPNALSAVRFILAIVVCILIEFHCYMAALVCFVIAASTDWIDGWWARKFNQVTKLGRILDPFVDKIIICGAMIALCAVDCPVSAWMATLVVGRELLVTSLRGMVEGSGGDFSAKQLGKWKMVAQCGAVIAVLLQLHYTPEATTGSLNDTPIAAPAWLAWTSFAFLWSALILTVVSGAEYVMIVLRSPTKAV